MKHLLLVLLSILSAASAAQELPPNDADFDATFGNGLGFKRYPASLGSVRRFQLNPELLKDRQGRYVLVAESESNGTARRLEIRRAQRNGDLDPAFGTGGVVQIVDPFGGLPLAAVDDGGAIYVVGSVSGGATGADFAAIRFRSDGSRDLDYGDAGMAVVAFTDPQYGSDLPHAVLVDDDGKLVIVGSTSGPPGTRTAAAIARLDRNGNVDPSFGSPAGRKIVHFEINGVESASARAVAQAADDSLYIAGELARGLATNPDDGFLLKMLPNGSLDPTFCPPADVTGGHCDTVAPVTTGVRMLINAPINASSQPEEINAIEIGPDGTVYIGGSLAQSNANDAGEPLKKSFGVFRVAPDGRNLGSPIRPRVELDTPPGFATKIFAGARALTVDSANRLVMFGSYLSRGSADLELAAAMRTRPSSRSIDQSFADFANFEAQPGQVFYHIADAGQSEFTTGTGVVMDGPRIVIAGLADSVVPNASDLYIGRLVGSLDELFRNGFE